jgi:hypothetical protein
MMSVNNANYLAKETNPRLKYPLFPPKLFKNLRGFVAVIVVCFVGGMLYYSMTTLWPQMSAQFFLPANKPIMRGLYSTIFSFGSFRTSFGYHMNGDDC